MSAEILPKCPKCNTAKHARANGHRMFFCTRCEMLFDDSGDDGTVGYGRPDVNAEREESRRLAEAERRKRALRNMEYRRRDNRKLKGGLER